jgi:hypothetical protein
MTHGTRAAWFVAALALFPLTGRAGDMPAISQPPQILAPRDGTIVEHRFMVQFSKMAMPQHAAMTAAKGMDGAGHRHLHLLIDAVPPAPGKPVPVDAHHLHFMNGETSTNVSLPPGRHTLQLLMAGSNHVPDNPPIVSQKVTVTVQ